MSSFCKKARPNAGTRGIKIRYDNASVHKSKLVQEYLTQENIETLPHHAYSPDLLLCDFFLFPRLKKYLAGRSFSTRSSIGTAIFQCLRNPTHDYRGALLQWVGRPKKCVAAEGEYFEQLHENINLSGEHNVKNNDSHFIWKKTLVITPTLWFSSTAELLCERNVSVFLGERLLVQRYPISTKMYVHKMYVQWIIGVSDVWDGTFILLF